VGQVEYD